jgi:hypothetical protein
MCTVVAMAMTLPHDPYMDLVHARLSDLGMFPTGFRTDDPDGEQLDAVFEFPDNSVSDDEWPDGVYLSWTSSDGWALTDTGSSRTTYPLNIDPYSDPAAVAAVTRARLAGRPELDLGSTDWDLRELISESVNAWIDQP